MGEGNKMIIIGSFVSPDLPTACLISQSAKRGFGKHR